MAGARLVVSLETAHEALLFEPKKPPNRDEEEDDDEEVEEALDADL
jgi:hypothetical protein